jgi:hypothetical protein
MQHAHTWVSMLNVFAMFVQVLKYAQIYILILRDYIIQRQRKRSGVKCRRCGALSRWQGMIIGKRMPCGKYNTSPELVSN